MKKHIAGSSYRDEQFAIIIVVHALALVSVFS